MFHVDAVRRPATAYPAGHLPRPGHPTDRRRAPCGLRGAASRQFETEYSSAAHPSPAGRCAVQAGRPLRAAGESTQAHSGVACSAAFPPGSRRSRRRLSARLVLERLDADAAPQASARMPHRSRHPVRTPPHGSYLNVVLADQELVGGFEPRIGRRAIRVVAVQGLPARLRGGAARSPQHARRVAFRWSTRVIPLGTHEAARLIRRHQLQWFKKRKGPRPGRRRCSAESGPTPWPRGRRRALPRSGCAGHGLGCRGGRGGERLGRCPLLLLTPRSSWSSRPTGARAGCR